MLKKSTFNCRKILKNKLNFKFHDFGYLPRWIIYIVDISIVFISLAVTFLLLKGLHLQFIQINYIKYCLGAYLLVNTYFFWLFKSYSGIIRHSSYTDAIKLICSQLASFVVIILINLILLSFDKQKICLTTGAFINAIFSFCLLFIYRIAVKQIFESFFLMTDNLKKMRAIIYGSDNNAIAVANALKVEIPNRFQLIGFVNKSNQNITKRLLDLPIIKIENGLSLLIKRHHIDAIIIADRSLNDDEKSLIVDECIELGIKVYTVPIILDWQDKKQISKGIKTFDIHDLLERKPIVLDSKLISTNLKRKTILVTGAAGSIGSEIVKQILKFEPDRLILLDQAETPLNSLAIDVFEQNKQIEIINSLTDIRDLHLLESVFAEYRPNVVYHAAAYKHVPMMEDNPLQAILTNVLGTKNIADLSYKYEVDTFVMVSTDKAVNPSSVMGASKRIAEMYIQSLYFMLNDTTVHKHTKFITTRFGNVLGSNGSVVPLFAKQIEQGGPITITHPGIIRYFMTIPEACQLVLEASAMGNGGEIYIFDMGKPIKIIDLARKMIRLAGFVPDKDILIKTIGLRPGEKLYEELLNDSAKTLPTHHHKIMIAVEVCNEYKIVNDKVLRLISLAKSKGIIKNELVILMKELIPEYKSLNSKYENV